MNVRSSSRDLSFSISKLFDEFFYNRFKVFGAMGFYDFGTALQILVLGFLKLDYAIYDSFFELIYVP